MHSSHCSMYNFQFSLPLSKSVRARELVLDALNGRCVEVEDDNDDIFVLSRALSQCTMHNAQCTIFAISEDNQTCLDCRAEQKSQPEGVMHNAQCTDLVKIETYDDHRVAMAMAVVGLTREIEIENPEVVNKSYPGFWEEMKKIK